MSFSLSTSVGRPSSSVSIGVTLTSPPCQSGAVTTSSTTAQTSSSGASISALALPPIFAIAAPLELGRCLRRTLTAVHGPQRRAARREGRAQHLAAAVEDEAHAAPADRHPAGDERAPAPRRAQVGRRGLQRVAP